MSKKLIASTIGAMMALGLLAWPTVEASATEAKPAARKPAITQPGLNSSQVRQRAETVRAAATRAAAKARKQSNGDSENTTGTPSTR